MVAEQTGRAAAFFDVDRTLLRGSSLLHVARPMRSAGLLPTRAMLHSVVMQMRFSMHGFDEAQIRDAVRGVGAIVEGIDADRLHEFARLNVPLHVLPRVYAQARARMAWHRARGEKVFLVSSSPREFIDVLGALLGVDAVAATDAELRDGRYTGRILRFCHGAAKAESVVELASSHGVDLARSWAYGDSFVSDLAMLEAVAHPVCVNPDRPLAAVAQRRGWPVERYRLAGVTPRASRLRRLPRRVAGASRPAFRRVRARARSGSRSLRDV